MLLTFLFSETLPTVFYTLLFMSITALMIGVAIMLVRRVADKWLSPFWKAALWILVVAALVVPFRPQSPLSLISVTTKVQDISFREEYDTAQSEYKAARIAGQTEGPTREQIEQLDAIRTRTEALHIKTLIFDEILPAVWLTGMLLIVCFLLLGGLRLRRKIKQSVIPTDMKRYERLLQDCKDRLHMKRKVQIFVQTHVKTPALMGMMHPKIILPEYVVGMSDETICYILLHELSHVKRGDNLVNMLLLLLQSVYWFNPLTWAMFGFIREDMEFANDAFLLKVMGGEAQKAYSRSLLEVLEGYSVPKAMPRLLCMVDSEKNMERRIKTMKLGGVFKKHKVIIAVFALAMIAITGWLFLTVNAKPDEEIPSIYVLQESGVGIQAVQFGSHWNIGNGGNPEYRQTDTKAPYQYNFADTDTIHAGEQAVLTLSGAQGEQIKNYKNALSYKIWNVDGALHDDGTRQATDSLSLRMAKDDEGNTILFAPFTPGAYVFEVELEYERGEVTYAFKLVVLEDTPEDTQNESIAFIPEEEQTPAVPVEITDSHFDGEGRPYDSEEELIFEDAHYTYCLTSKRSDKIMLTFEDGTKLSLKAAIEQNRIGIDDLIQNGLQFWMQPKNNPLGGEFNIPYHLCRFSINGTSIYPTNTFMYSAYSYDQFTYTDSFDRSIYISYFALDELLDHLEKTGHEEKADRIRNSGLSLKKEHIIEGIQYLSESELESVGVYVEIGWVYSSHTPVWFTVGEG